MLWSGFLFYDFSSMIFLLCFFFYDFMTGPAAFLLTQKAKSSRKAFELCGRTLEN